jgi:hypothetical protein
MRKRKCGREKPHCSHCVHLHRNSTGPNPCTYPHLNQSTESTDHTEKRQKSDPASTNLSYTEKKNEVEDIKEVSEKDDSGSAKAAVENTAPIETPKPAHHPPANIDATPSSAHRKNSDGLISPKSSKKLSGGSLESLLHAASQPPTNDDMGSTKKELGEKPVSLPYQLSSLNSTQKGLLSPP